MNLSFKLRLPFSLCTALLALAVPQLSCAAESASFSAIIADDFKYVATAPSRWEDNEWKNVGWATLAVVGTSIIADRPMRNFMCQQAKETSCDPSNTPVNNSFLTTVENLGQTYSLGVMGGFYVAGALANDEKSIRVSQDLVAASLVSVTINQTIKTFANRYRPRDNQAVDNFRGYTGLNNNSSFPSGHTTEAFTLASVIATHYEETWVSYTAYSLAGLVGVARMYHDAHYASDVVASAFIGTWVGKSIVNHNSTLRTNKIVMLPLIGPDFTGMQIVGNF